MQFRNVPNLDTGYCIARPGIFQGRAFCVFGLGLWSAERGSVRDSQICRDEKDQSFYKAL